MHINRERRDDDIFFLISLFNLNPWVQEKYTKKTWKNQMGAGLTHAFKACPHLIY